MNNFDIAAFVGELQKKNFWRNLFLFIIGTLLSALAFNLFYRDYDIVPTGTSGLSLLLSRYIPVDISIIIFVVGLCCLTIGLVGFGWEYATKMLAITILYPVFVSLTNRVTSFIDLEDTSLFLIVVIGGGLVGLSNGLIRNSGYNTGGFGVIFDLMHKYLHIGIGSSTIIVNMLLILSSIYIFGVDKAIYAIIALIMSSFVVDRVTIGISDNKVFYIVTEKPFEVRDLILDKLHYNVTIINARGGYTNKKRKMLMSVISTKDYIMLKELVKKIDSKVFFLIVDAYESNTKKKM